MECQRRFGVKLDSNTGESELLDQVRVLERMAPAGVGRRRGGNGSPWEEVDTCEAYLHAKYLDRYG